MWDANLCPGTKRYSVPSCRIGDVPVASQFKISLTTLFHPPGAVPNCSAEPGEHALELEFSSRWCLITVSKTACRVRSSSISAFLAVRHFSTSCARMTVSQVSLSELYSSLLRIFRSSSYPYHLSFSSQFHDFILVNCNAALRRTY